MLVDFHTHKLPLNRRITALVNLPLPVDLIPESAALRFSAGIHPWQLVNLSASALEQQLEQLEQIVSSGKLNAIGECGLDRAISPALTEQCTVFEFQIQLAEKYHIPLIIHCVRAYSELITIAKAQLASQPWIIHGFNGNSQQLELLLKYDRFYFSFGPALLKQPAKFAPLLQMVSKSRLLLETDDSNANIMNIYRQTAKLCGCSYNELSEQLEKNWKTLFR